MEAGPQTNIPTRFPVSPFAALETTSGRLGRNCPRTLRPFCPGDVTCDSGSSLSGSAGSRGAGWSWDVMCTETDFCLEALKVDSFVSTSSMYHSAMAGLRVAKTTWRFPLESAGCWSASSTTASENPAPEPPATMRTRSNWARLVSDRPPYGPSKRTFFVQPGLFVATLARRPVIPCLGLMRKTISDALPILSGS